MIHDIRFTLRSLLRQPGFALVALLTLGLGVGANTAIFSILNAVLVEDLPYRDPDRLYALRSMDATGAPNGRMAPRFARPFYEDHASVEAASLAFALAGSIVAADLAPYPFLPYNVTPRFFNVFDDAIAMGRGFEADEPAESIVISHATWRDHFGSDPDIVGSVITVDNSQRQVIGVTRESFEFPEGAGSWAPINIGPALDDLINFEAYLRLRPGVTEESFAADLVRMSGELGPNQETGEALTYVLRPLLEEVVGDIGSTVLLLSGATALLLLIACLNVANLLFARANARAHEIGLREALGAGRGRIIRQLLTESFLLSAAGGALGIVLAIAAVRLLLGIGPADLPRLGTVAIEGNVLLFSLATVLLTTLLTGLAPAIRLSRSELRGLLSTGGRGGSGGRGEKRLFGALVVAEVALAVVLVIGAGLLVRSYVNLATTDPGFVAGGILNVRLNATHIAPDVQVREAPDGTPEFSGTGYQPVINFYDDLLGRIRGLAGVVDVASAQELPLNPNPTQASQEPFTIAGRPGEEYQVRLRPVSADFFRTLGAPILEGRDIEATDRRGTAGVGVVNEAFVRRYFPNEAPLGQRIGLPSGDFEIAARGYGFAERIYDSVEIVGVVSDVRFAGRFEPPPPYLFMSADQFTTRMRNLAVKTDLADPRSLIPAIRGQVAEVAPTVPVEFGLYEEIVDGSIARERLGMALLSVFAGIALVLAAVGVYGVMAYSVNRRTGELAVRAALGATRNRLLAGVVGQGARLGLAGVALGLAGAIAARQVIAGQLYGVSPLDPVVMTLVPLVLLAVSIAASLLPARRASAVDPIVALREE
jgi:predicted permease